jgi:hypothetical protein
MIFEAPAEGPALGLRMEIFCDQRSPDFPVRAGSQCEMSVERIFVELAESKQQGPELPTLRFHRR